MSASAYQLPGGVVVCADELTGFRVVQTPTADVIHLRPPKPVTQSSDPIVFAGAM